MSGRTQTLSQPPAAVRTAFEYLDTIVTRDPSIRTRAEAALHPSAIAVLSHRLAHRLYRKELYKAARALSTVARLASGIEIHPGASIGPRLFIDHGAGVVIGETAVIGHDVTIFQQATLGSTGWWNDNGGDPSKRRHPKLGDGVTIGANASVLGAITVGDYAVIGAHSLVVCDVPEKARVHAPRAVIQSDRTEVIDGTQRHPWVRPQPDLRAV
jgi:serine O-acetyltransferase